MVCPKRKNMDKLKSIFCQVLTGLKSDCEESDLEEESPSSDSDILIDIVSDPAAGIMVR